MEALVVSSKPWIDACWWLGEYKILPFYMGTAYNAFSMEDTMLHGQQKYAAQNIIHLCFKNRALAPLQIPASLYEGPIYLLLC